MTMILILLPKKARVSLNIFSKQLQIMTTLLEKVNNIFFDIFWRLVDVSWGIVLKIMVKVFGGNVFL